MGVCKRCALEWDEHVTASGIGPFARVTVVNNGEQEGRTVYLNLDTVSEIQASPIGYRAVLVMRDGKRIEVEESPTSLLKAAYDEL